MKKDHAEKFGERRKRQIPEQTWWKARQALMDRGLCIFIFFLIFKNLSLDFKKGKLKKGGGERELFKSQHFNPRRENHWIHQILGDPRFQITSLILGPTSLWLLHCSGSGPAANPQTLGLGPRNPLSQPPGLPCFSYHLHLYDEAC
ncbi:unnamed protein product [Rangifer tarandus platyrhynchus]|uniref:Uncharacterized protein n=2 Tax=Rangifer tarandus platyrhynchus TaxID=3082113 RepID=A0AC59ZBF7_RANTA|nr:unnamed protein product [Rangifer tarandus platyrhynchus]